MKTARITIYQMHGTTAYACDIEYKAKHYQTMQNVCRYECSKLAFLWAKKNGFTHGKLLGIDKPYTVNLNIFEDCYIIKK